MSWSVPCQKAMLAMLVTLLSLGLIGGLILPAEADDLNALAKEVTNELRSSQRMMFNGKLEEALKHLEKAAELIEQIKAADPEFNQLKSLQSKYEKQKKDLERRLPKEKPAEPAPAEESKQETGEGSEDLQALAKEANSVLGASQRAMFSSKFEEAQEGLKKAAELIEKIKAADPAFNQLKSLEGKYEKQKKDLEKRLPKETPPKAETTQTEPTTAEKLPSAVTSRLKDIDQGLQRGEDVLSGDLADDRKIGRVESRLQAANDLMDQIMSGYGDQIPQDHPEVKARQDSIAGLQQKLEELKAKVAAKEAQAAEAEAQIKALSNEWLEKIAPYATGLGKPGYDESKYLIGSGTHDVDELVRRKAIYQEAKAVFEEFQKVAFPDGQTIELELAAKDLAYNIKGFEEGYQETLDWFASKANEELDRTEQWLSDQEAKAQSEAEKKPVYLSNLVISGIQNAIFSLDAATAGEDSRLPSLNERLAKVEERAEKLRQMGIERTVMLPDKYTGQDSETLKAKAAEFLHKEYADAEVLRTTIISGDWTEERVWEYTDTSKTAIRYRVTQSITAQIAGKRGSDVFLYTIHIAKNQRTDGSWGELYGHVMYIDPMLEENVNK